MLCVQASVIKDQPQAAHHMAYRTQFTYTLQFTITINTHIQYSSSKRRGSLSLLDICDYGRTAKYNKMQQSGQIFFWKGGEWEMEWVGGGKETEGWDFYSISSLKLMHHSTPVCAFLCAFTLYSGIVLITH